MQVFEEKKIITFLGLLEIATTLPLFTTAVFTRCRGWPFWRGIIIWKGMNFSCSDVEGKGCSLIPRERSPNGHSLVFYMPLTFVLWLDICVFTNLRCYYSKEYILISHLLQAFSVPKGSGDGFSIYFIFKVHLSVLPRKTTTNKLCFCVIHYETG